MQTNLNVLENSNYFNLYILPEAIQEYRHYIIEGARIMTERKKFKYASYLPDGMGGYHCRKKDQLYSLKRNVKRQLRGWERTLTFVDTSYPMLYVTLTTDNKDLTFNELDKQVKSFLDKVSYNFDNYFAYIRRLELSEDLYKHAHLILFFKGNNTPRKFTRPWVQNHWTLGTSVDVQKVYNYEGLKNYICKSEKHEFFKQGEIMYSYYDYGMKLISTSRNLPMTDDIKVIVNTDKYFGKELAEEMGLTHYHQVYSISYINGVRVKNVERTFYY